MGTVEDGDIEIGSSTSIKLHLGALKRDLSIYSVIRLNVNDTITEITDQ